MFKKGLEFRRMNENLVIVLVLVAVSVYSFAASTLLKEKYERNIKRKREQRETAEELQDLQKENKEKPSLLNPSSETYPTG